MVSAQVAGVVMVGVGVALLWSWWALVVAGVLLVVAPEVVDGLRVLAGVRREQRAAREAAAGERR